MNEYFIFINSKSDLEIAEACHTHLPNVKVRLHETALLSGKKTNLLWIDCAFDGFPIENPKAAWSKFMLQQKGSELLSDPLFLSSPKKELIEPFVKSILNKQLELKPDIISIPQLPYSYGTSHNKINRLLIKIFNLWKIESAFKGDCILPIVINHKDVTLEGSERSKKVDLIISNYKDSNADGIWIIDSKLQDQAGVGNFEKQRFPSLIDLHTRVHQQISSKYHVAGPYWGINLVLWAKGISNYPAFSLGTGFQHYSPSGYSHKGIPRMAIPSLRRFAKATSDLRKWLVNSTMQLTGNDASDMQTLVKVFDDLRLSKNHKLQVYSFYLAWFNSLTKIPKAGRGVALYQDLSQAYVLSSNLEEIQSEDGTSKKPGVVARQLMLNCL